jgi:DNA-binding LytR/AlgR family response regulator
MKKLSCVIIDDEPAARKLLHEFVEKVPYLDLRCKFENAIKAEAYLRNDEVDIIFLDIEMPEISGLQFLKMSEIKSLVILTTAFNQYALEGYQLDIIDYLLKPFPFDRFLKAVQKARDYIELKNAASGHLTSSYIFVRSEKRIEKIEFKDFLYAETLGNYVRIHLENKKIISFLTLKSLESQVPPNEFIKIHQSFLVNSSKINAIEGNEVRINEIALPIGRNYRESVMQMVQERLVKR